MFKVRLTIFTIAMFFSGILLADTAEKKNFDYFNLKLLIINATADTTNEVLEKNAIAKWISQAESKYSTKPSLKLTYTIERKKMLGQTRLSNLAFNSNAEFGKFMDDNFDNYARTETDGHLTLLVGDTLCIGKKCWGGMAFFPHDVNPFNRKRGIWMAALGDEYLLTHELGHFFSLKHTFEPYLGLDKQCNKDFKNKNVLNPTLGHCNSCDGVTEVRTHSDGSEYYVCNKGASNVMDYCTALNGRETLNTCQQERSADQRRQYLTNDGDVNYIKLAGLRGDGQCTDDSQCNTDEFCTAGVLDITRNVCNKKKSHGQTCTDKRQCSSDRCSWGFCADADECKSSSDCKSEQYCGDPISGKQTCKDLKPHGAGCTKADQCSTGRCSWGFCADGDECKSNSDCKSGQRCGDPIAGKQKCKDLHPRGHACTSGDQCASGKCPFLTCK